MANLYQYQSSNVRRTWLLFAVFFVVIVGLGWVFSNVYQDNSFLIFAVLFSVIYSFISYYSSAAIALRLARAQQAEYLALKLPPKRDLRVGLVWLVGLIAVGDALLYISGYPLVTPFQVQSYTTAAAEGWTVVSDTSYPGYRDIPLDVMHGYGVMAGEIERQMRGTPAPTHVIVQAGVGAMAAAICASFWMHWGQDRPRFVVVEPMLADCIYRSVEQGRRVTVHGSLETVMAGLACGEVSELAWEILRGGVNACVTIDDAYALESMRRLARPVAGDPPVVAGETGGAGLAALLAAMDHPDIRQALALDDQSRVVIMGSEGDTDPVIYREIVGSDAAGVLG